MSERSAKVLVDRASVTRILTAAETLDLNSTEIVLVADPGDGKAIVPELCILSKPGGTAGAGGGNVTIRVGTESIMDDTRSNVFPAAVRSRMLTPNDASRLRGSERCNIHMATADMTGNDQPLTVTLIYSIVEL